MAVGAALAGTAGMLVARTAQAADTMTLANLGAMLMGATGLPVLARLVLLAAVALLLPLVARRWWLGALLRRFSPVAALSVAVLVGTGLYPALVHIPSAQALYTTRYGIALLVKLGLVAALLGVAATNLLYVGPGCAGASLWTGCCGARLRLRWGLLAAALAAAALLTNVAPTRWRSSLQASR